MIKVLVGKNKRTLELRENHNFDWLNKVEIFAIFNQQDSGNISFGVISNGEQFFIKYAGARNLEYTGEIQAAIERLKKAEEVYKHIVHQNLTPFLSAFQIEQGFGLKFKWVNGECMHNHWDFTPF